MDTEELQQRIISLQHLINKELVEHLGDQKIRDELHEIWGNLENAKMSVYKLKKLTEKK